MLLKRAMLVIASTAALSCAFIPVASAQNQAPTARASGQHTAASPKEGETPYGDFNSRKECDDAGVYNVYVAHTQGATGYECKSYTWIPNSDPRCHNTTNNDGCIGEWWKLYLVAP